MDMGEPLNHDHDHGSGDTGATTCPMIMAFHGGHCERILWRGWVASTITQFVFSSLALFAVAFLYEFLKFLREYLLRRAVRQEAERIAAEMAKISHLHHQSSSIGGGGSSSDTPLAEVKENTYWERIFGISHLVQTMINVVQVTLGYMLMLVFMNYNYWLCLAVILGMGFGYFFFGWIRQNVYESECCH